MNLNRKSIRLPAFTAVLAGLLTLATTGLAADELRLTGGIWAGEISSELENRYMMDDIITHPNANSRLDLPWGSQNSYALYPLSLQYQTGFWKGDLIARVSFLRHTPEYSFIGILVPNASSLSIVNLDDYTEDNLEGDLGYQMKLAGGKFFLTPFVGYRHHYKEFTYNELTLGNPVGISLSGLFQGNARSIYLGVGGQFFITKAFSVLGEYRRTSPVLGDLPGDMSFEMIRAYSNNTFTWDQASAEMVIDFQRVKIGAQYDITKDFHIQAGVMEERVRTEYPDYYNIPIIITNGGIGVNGVNTILFELLSDNYLVYPAAEQSKKGMVYLSASYDFSM